MKSILVASQKGGVGKSVIADELAFSFERTNTPMSFYDMDGQGGVLHETAQREDAVVAVIDTPGALQQQLKDWIAAADLIIIPTRPTSRDIEPLKRMRRAVTQAQANGVPVLYVVNGFNRFRASGDFLEWFRRSTDKRQIYTLPQSEQIVQASAAGMSVVEYAKRSGAAHDIKALCNAVRALVGIEREK